MFMLPSHILPLPLSNNLAMQPEVINAFLAAHRHTKYRYDKEMMFLSISCINAQL